MCAARWERLKIAALESCETLKMQQVELKLWILFAPSTEQKCQLFSKYRLGHCVPKNYCFFCGTWGSMGDMLTEAQSCNSRLHQNLSKALTSKTAVSRSCWGSIAEDITLRAGILSVLFMNIHTPQSLKASQVHSKHFNVCWMNTWKKYSPFLIQTSSVLGHRGSRLGSMQTDS